MKNDMNPSHLDVAAFAKAQVRLEGDTPLAQFARLAEDCAGELTGNVTWAAQGAMEPQSGGQDEVWLHVEAHTHVPLTCQRCLSPVSVALEIAQDFRFVADEETAIAEDEESEEDVLVMTDAFDLMELIEDELLMSLPLVPMHQACLSEQTPISKEEEAILSQEKPNPFAVLAALKTRKS
ncbi:hypothetical protein C5F52_23900 [Limnohabitans sp. TS-CS-82]|jgi:uncharacterized protein|uniref:YceD family protein n=1 Tax=Limnohabitans sp. TS-CS-82 TaxID=2094193 RepID=UPI000CF2B179|nr:YceD family protein [Limnohabitans sp. TS-CS-82]PQA80754.1 hypothetical protein C5F52_23900 [Limnohabitans sp. TS-CS-82]